MTFEESMQHWELDTLELGEDLAECLWYENNIYRQNGNALMWHRDSLSMYPKYSMN